ncbi:MAG: hypothetical protein JNG86_07355, partial [Verrucomicrobiaceae bacterium]|nr:hypothetical protein [Verrucomicrobiaceae bacterium]
MEFWQITSKRAQQTLAVWNRLMPAFCLKSLGTPDLWRMMGELESCVQARTEALSDYKRAFRAGQEALRDLKKIGKAVAKVLKGHLDDDMPLKQALRTVCRTIPRTEATILRRMRELLPLWERFDTNRAACLPPQPPLILWQKERVLDVEAARGLLSAYEGLVQTIQLKAVVLRERRAALHEHERAIHRLNKRWYQVAKAS